MMDEQCVEAWVRILNQNLSSMLVRPELYSSHDIDRIK